MSNKLTGTLLLLFTMLSACSGGGGSDGNTATTTSGAGTPPASPPSTTTPAVPGTVEFSATFATLGPFRSTQSPVEGFSNDGKWWVEQKAPGRATVINVGRAGGSGLRLHTEPGDTNVAGSGANERNDVGLQVTEGVQGKEQWWAHSLLFPDDFAIPPMQPGAFAVVFDFHHTGTQPGQPNFHILVNPGGFLTFGGQGGPDVVDASGNQFSYGADIGVLAKNVWYDFVYHVKWSENSDGYFKAWVNGALKLDHRGPTLYAGHDVYLKLANYHTPFGQASSVMHDRVIRGTTWQIVSLTPLEGLAP